MGQLSLTSLKLQKSTVNTFISSLTAALFAVALSLVFTGSLNPTRSVSADTPVQSSLANATHECVAPSSGSNSAGTSATTGTSSNIVTASELSSGGFGGGGGTGTNGTVNNTNSSGGVSSEANHDVVGASAATDALNNSLDSDLNNDLNGNKVLSNDSVSAPVLSDNNVLNGNTANTAVLSDILNANKTTVLSDLL